MRFKISIFTGLFLTGLILPLLSSPVEAAGLACLGDYTSYLRSVRSENSRGEGIKDVISLGYCQLNDIMTLDDELDRVRDSLRTTAASCGSMTSDKLEYERILMEMYFVRHLQEGDVLNVVDEEALEAAKEQKLASLKTTMQTVFVDEEKRVDKQTFSSYFDSWAAKYDDRIADYRKCEEGPWAELSTTLADFVVDIYEFTESAKSLKSSVETTEKQSVKDILIPVVDPNVDEDMTAIGNSILKAWEYLKGEEARREAELEPPETVSSVGDSGGSLTIDGALEALNTSFQDYSLDKKSIERLSMYSKLYGAGGSVQSTNLQSIMQELNSILEAVNTKDLPSIAATSAKVSEKQCN
jgi:hypothetical protein